MMKSYQVALIALFSLPVVSWAQVASAQSEPEDEVELIDDVEMDEEGIADDEYDFSSDESGGLIGGDENPDQAPAYAFADRTKEKTKEKVEAPTGYPLRTIDRPINLPGGMSELFVAADVNVDPFAIGGQIEGKYGITDEVQIGLAYGLGTFSDSKFSTGKAVALEGQYLFTDYIAGQLAIPVYLDPLAVGLVLGAPMKFTFFDSFSLVLGRDLLGFRLHQFLPSVGDARLNDKDVANLDDGTIIPLWTAKASLTAIYQHSEDLSLDAEFGQQFDDSERAKTTLLNVGVLYAKSQKFDLGARLGASDLAFFTETLTFRLFLNVRI